MSPLAHLIAIVVYAAVAVAFGSSLGASLDPGQGGPYIFSAVLFLGFALVHEVYARTRAQEAGRAAMASEKQAMAERCSDAEAALDEMHRRIEGLNRDGGEQHNNDMAVLKTLLGQLAERLGANFNIDAGSDIVAAEADVRRVLHEALEANRVDLYLQPVVSLPQRRSRFYECYSRIRDESGQVIASERYITLAAEHGLIATVDNLLLLRCVQLIRRQRRQRRDVGFFVNLSLDSISDGSFFDQFLLFLESNVALADRMVFEFAQADLLRHAADAPTKLARMAELGYSFSLDQVTSFDIDCAWLAKQSFRFVKIEADRLLAGAERLNRLKGELGRHQIDLIAEKVEKERTVVDLLDLDVDYAQGWLFGEPRRSREAV
jgi:cyclic-di-GMP phosphodiesterase TipF (flagellum assembly factor)